jgi:prepilin-type processing-associated H-X9-DG protein/prepilin-type N-terminal cleavage/methylation domain-containing protein
MKNEFLTRDLSSWSNRGFTLALILTVCDSTVIRTINRQESSNVFLSRGSSMGGGSFRSASSSLGFTLTELIVVLGIIGILAALSLGAYSSILRTSKAMACMGNLRQLSQATILYTNDHGGSFPQADAPTTWDVSIQPYLGGSAQSPINVLRCPADPRPLVIIPGGNWQSSYARSYAISAVSGDLGVSGSSWNATTTTSSRRLVQVASPNKMILFTECFAIGNYQFNSGYSWTPAGEVDNSLYPAGQLTHGKQMNFAFVDGHVESLTLDQAQAYW